MFNRLITTLFFISAYVVVAYSQTYDCKVFKRDGGIQTLYQVVYKVEKDNKFLFEGKSYFDGGIAIPVVKKGVYKLLLSYPGYRDTTITFSYKDIEDKKKGFDSVFLVKNGMRLLGKVIDINQDLPIQDAVLILRNVMTRAEYMIKTNIEGDFNFRLDYETNYQLKVDKYSPGIINKYQDTSFYISTIGFNLPLDFKLDIYLPKARGYITPRTVSYTFDSTNIKPVLALKKSDEFLQKDSLLVSSKTIAIATPPTQSTEEIPKIIPPKIENTASSTSPIKKLDQLKQIENDLSQIRAERKLAEEEKIAKKAGKKNKKGNEKVIAIAYEPKTALDSLKLRQKQILEARKRIEEQNKVIYEKKKRETYESTQEDMIAYYEKKIKNATNTIPEVEVPKAAEKIEPKLEPKKVDMNTLAGRGKVMVYGRIYNASNQLRLPNANISIRPINSIFSKEVTTDNSGYFQVEADSAMVFVISFFKEEFKISKQLLDLSEKKGKSYELQDIYLSEDFDVEITKDMPALSFDKNKSELTENAVEELSALAILLQSNRSYTIRLVGLAAADETYIKPLSTSRVSQVAQFLVGAGVATNQVKFIALGDTKRRSNCGAIKPCTTQDYNNDRVVVYIINQ